MLKKIMSWLSIASSAVSIAERVADMFGGDSRILKRLASDAQDYLFKEHVIVSTPEMVRVYYNVRSRVGECEAGYCYVVCLVDEAAEDILLEGRDKLD